MCERVICAPTTNKCWWRLLTTANIQDLRFHDLRHESASMLSERGMNAMKMRDHWTQKSTDAQAPHPLQASKIDDPVSDLGLPRTDGNRERAGLKVSIGLC